MIRPASASAWAAPPMSFFIRRMPLWQPYEDMLKSDIADFANASNRPMAGSITAALFLKKFVPDEVEWAHLDTYAWRDTAEPGRPKGGEALGLRAVFATLLKRYRNR
jgi:leucyl aminopeptidase